MIARLREEAQIFLLAVQFLTRLPAPAAFTPARLAAAPRYYPLVGALVGALGGAIYWAAAQALPPLAAAILSTAVTVLATGAFHEDGLADACDGLGGGATRAQALEIMRDSRIGSYGALALILALGLKVSLLAAAPPATGALLLLAGHAASRTSSVLAIATGRYARDHGTAKPVAEGVSAAGLLLALGFGAAAAWPLWLWLGLGVVLAGLSGLALMHLAMRLAYERKLGGYTGDCLGAVQQTSELGFYLGVFAALGVQ